MTLEIVKPELIESDVSFDVNTARALIAAGMVNDIITDLHSAVEAAGASNGSQVEDIYHDLLKELRNLIVIANNAAASGALIDDIIDAINKDAVNFTPLDLKTMMEEVYGSITLWKQAMIPDES